MESSGLDSDVPSDPPKGVSGEAWLPKLLSYMNTIRPSLPNVPHPEDDWVTDGAKALSLGQTPSAVGQSSVQLDTARDQKLERIERILDEHTKRNTAAELRARQTYLEQREKNRQVRVTSSLKNLISTMLGIYMILKCTS